MTTDEKLVYLSHKYLLAISEATAPGTSIAIMLGALGIVIGNILSKWREHGGRPNEWIKSLQADQASRLQ
jgi:hypothetical protein